MRKVVGAIVLAASLGFVLFLWHPVCVPITDVDLKTFNVPIEQRTGERMWGIQTFQRKDGHWYQCKPWLARQFFF